nr:MAG TPA: hypothetical protein [Caudoviricetes sp.]
MKICKIKEENMAKKKFELNRKDYLNIKKMDHYQMSL